MVTRKDVRIRVHGNIHVGDPMTNYLVKQLSLSVAYASYLIDLPGGFEPYFGNLGGRGCLKINDDLPF